MKNNTLRKKLQECSIKKTIDGKMPVENLKRECEMNIHWDYLYNFYLLTFEQEVWLKSEMQRKCASTDNSDTTAEVIQVWT